MMARGLSRLMGVMMADLSSAGIPYDLVITGAIVGIFVTLLAALIPALNAGRISPLEALLSRAFA